MRNTTIEKMACSPSAFGCQKFQSDVGQSAGEPRRVGPITGIDNYRFEYYYLVWRHIMKKEESCSLDRSAHFALPLLQSLSFRGIPRPGITPNTEVLKARPARHQSTTQSTTPRRGRSTNVLREALKTTTRRPLSCFTGGIRTYRG